MKVFDFNNYEPKVLWQRFYELSQYPRPSKKEEKALAYLKNLAKEKNYVIDEDEVGNLVIRIPATQGYENSPVVVLQGHVDMVCEKNKGTEHDFENDPLKLVTDDEWVKAEGTTLGADNGIGIAAGLAIAEDSASEHGPLEILITVDEETGLTGANCLSDKLLKGKILLNLDSEDDGVFTIGCSGGQDTVGFLSIEKQLVEGFVPFNIFISGLKGGHSGVDINKERANANKLLARTLLRLKKYNYFLADIKGGSLRNAIPRESEAVILINEKDTASIIQDLLVLQNDFVNEVSVSDPGIKIKGELFDGAFSEAFTQNFRDKLIDLLLAIPHGIIAMSNSMPGLVETSTNLATINITGDKLRIGTSQRSSIESAKNYVTQIVQAAITLAGGESEINDGYPGWQPNVNSKLLGFTKQLYKKMYNEEPVIEAIHAGLECGILGAKYPGMDMISFGPTITGAHSPDEKVHIKAVEKFYDFLKHLLKEIAENEK